MTTTTEMDEQYFDNVFEQIEILKTELNATEVGSMHADTIRARIDHLEACIAKGCRQVETDASRDALNTLAITVNNNRWINCGERSVQKHYRVSVYDVCKNNDIEPGDRVEVYIKSVTGGHYDA